MVAFEPSQAARPEHTKMKPSTFLIAIYPGFQFLDLAGPVDILNILSLPPFNANISLKFIAESLDPVPTKPIPPPNAKWTFDIKSALSQPSVNTSFNQYLLPDVTYSSYLASLELQGPSATSSPPDVLIIPGGIGSRLLRTPSPQTSPSTNLSIPDSSATLNIQTLLDFITRVAPHVSTAILTVCTGSDILGRTGLLNARRATTNMMRFKDVAARHTDVKWQFMARWVRSLPSETDGTGFGREIWSSAGISAGMDVTLAFVVEYYGGVEVARDIAKRLEYDWREVGEGERDPLYERTFGGS